MAVYRLHKKEWERASRHLPLPLTKLASPATTIPSILSTIPSKRKETEEPSESESEKDEELELNPGPSQPANTNGRSKKKAESRTQPPGGGRKGVSSGLSTIVRRQGSTVSTTSGGVGRKKVKSAWWKQLPGSGIVSSRAKGSISLGSWCIFPRTFSCCPCFDLQSTASLWYFGLISRSCNRKPSSRSSQNRVLFEKLRWTMYDVELFVAMVSFLPSAWEEMNSQPKSRQPVVIAAMDQDSFKVLVSFSFPDSASSAYNGADNCFFRQDFSLS